MRSRHALAATALAVTLGVAGCASTTNGTPAGNGPTSPTVGDTTTPVSHGSTPPAVTSSTPTSPGNVTPTGAVSLATLMQQAVANVTSAHIELRVDTGGQSITASGDEQLSGGKLSGMDLSENLPGGVGSFEIIVADGKIYAKLPASINPSNKPWVLVSKNSSSQIVQTLAASLNSTLQQASVSNVNEFVSAAKSVKLEGSENVGGVQATHYKIDVDVAKLPVDMSESQEIQAAGINDIPIDLYLDQTGRPVKLTEHIEAAGQSVDVDIDISKYNQPVNIQAPPASQVSTD